MDLLKVAAQNLEKSYLTQMLSASGYDKILPKEISDFAPFLLEAQSEAIIKNGGTGLSEAIFQAITTQARK